MNKKLWVNVCGFIILMLPAIVGAANPTACYDSYGVAVNCNAYDYVQVTESASTIVGNWKWFNNRVYDIRVNKTIYEGTVNVGTWTLNTSPVHTLVWNNGYTDTLTLSVDGTKLDGTNQKGRKVTGTKISSGSTSCPATINSNLVLYIPYLSYNVPLLGIDYLEVEFAYVFDPFNLLNLPDPAKIYFKLTDYSNNPNTPSCTTVSELINAEIKSPAVGDPLFLQVRIPDVVFPNGAHYWVGLLYEEAVSIANGDIYFSVYLYAN